MAVAATKTTIAAMTTVATEEAKKASSSSQGTRSSRHRSPAVTASSRLCEVVGEKVHEEGVVPVALGASFVLAHSADRLEADLGVAADGCGVVGSGVDANPMVIALIEQVGSEGADGVRPDALPVHFGTQVDIDGGMPVVGFGFFRPLNAADYLAGYNDRKEVKIRRVDVVDELRAKILAAPALSHFRHPTDRNHHLHVGQHCTTQHGLVALQEFVAHGSDTFG
jgi:hypothetical protein